MRRSLAGLALAVFVGACGARTQLRGGEADGSGALIPDFAWYRLDETKGTTAHDSSSHHFDVVAAGPTWGDDDGYGTKRFYKGRMRDVRIYKHALDGGAVETLFANGPV